MNRFESMSTGLRVGIVVLIFGAVIAAGFFFQEWLRDTLLVSILYAFWVGDLAFDSFDQKGIAKGSKDSLIRVNFEKKSLSTR